MLIRADASVGIGTGHVMRCLALAQAWRDRGGSVEFTARALPEALEKRLESEGIRCLRLSEPTGGAGDARHTAEFVAASGAAWAVVDGYRFGATYRRTLRQSGVRLLFFEDVCGERSQADAVLNPGVHTDSGTAPGVDERPRLLLGASYAPLRREFRAFRGWTRPLESPAKRILVTLGGSDPGNATSLVLGAVGRLKAGGLQIRAVVGPANPHRAALEREVRGAPCDIRLEDPSVGMPELMAWADLAITAAGSTCWELAFMGVPMVTVVLAENQRLIDQSLSASGAAVSVGRLEDLEPHVLAGVVEALISSDGDRLRMSRRGRALVDGLGAERVTDELQSVSAGSARA